MIDIHSHVLPGLDDGPPELEGSLALARAAAAAGTRTLVATPHIRDDHPFPIEALDSALPGLAEQSDWFTRVAPEAIVAGKDLPQAPPPPEISSRWRRRPKLRRARPRQPA